MAVGIYTGKLEVVGISEGIYDAAAWKMVQWRRRRLIGEPQCRVGECSIKLSVET